MSRCGLHTFVGCLIFSGLIAAGESAAAPSCSMERVVATPDQAWQIDAWSYPEYPQNVCMRRLPKNDWFGHYIGHPLVTKMTGDFNGDGCDQDVLWRVPYSDGWVLNLGMGGTEVISDGSKSFAPFSTNQAIATYPIGTQGQEGVVWSKPAGDSRISYFLDGSQSSSPDSGIDDWLSELPNAARFSPAALNIVAIGDSFTAGQWSDPLANFRERLWQQLGDYTSCQREISLNWVGSERDFNASAEPYLYGNPFFIDKDHEGHGGYHTCHIDQCIGDWMAGNACARDKDAAEICAVRRDGSATRAYTPDLALLMIGMNDVLWKESGEYEYRGPFIDLTDNARLAQAAENILSIVAKLRQRNPQVTTLLSGVPGGGSQIGLSEYLDIDYTPGGYAEWLATKRDFLANKNYRRFNHSVQQTAVRLASSSAPIMYVDQYSQYAGVPGTHWDSIHPDYAGHQQIADAYAGVLAGYWESDSRCVLPDLGDLAEASSGSFLIADFDGDGCAQDVAYRVNNNGNWGAAWQISLAGNAGSYALSAQTNAADFNPGDQQQFLAAVDFDNDGKADIVERHTGATTWRVSYGDPAKPAAVFADNWKAPAPAYDLSSKEVIVAYCNWGHSTWLGWTPDADSLLPRWNFLTSTGYASEIQFGEGWRELPMFISNGYSPNAACHVIGNH